jgi:hypothetical protein
MGNKDARRREVRKPKKKTPKQAPQKRDMNPTAQRILKKITD